MGAGSWGVGAGRRGVEARASGPARQAEDSGLIVCRQAPGGSEEAGTSGDGFPGSYMWIAQKQEWEPDVLPGLQVRGEAKEESPMAAARAQT